MVQFQSLLKLSPPTADCFYFVCFAYLLRVSAATCLRGMINVVMMMMCISLYAFISRSTCICFRRRIDHFEHQNEVIILQKSSRSPEITTFTPMEALLLPFVIIQQALTQLCLSSIHNQVGRKMSPLKIGIPLNFHLLLHLFCNHLDLKRSLFL